MSIRFAAPALALAFAGVALAGPANAQANVMKQCGEEYQAAKSANTLGGKNWNEYLKDCRVRHAGQPAVAAPAAQPAANPLKPAAAAPAATPAAGAGKPVSAGRAAANSRQKTCGAEWRAKKDELRKANPNIKWPQYWSECNKRLKAAGQ